MPGCGIYIAQITDHTMIPSAVADSSEAAFATIFINAK